MKLKSNKQNKVKAIVVKIQPNVVKRLNIIRKELEKEEDEHVSYNKTIKQILKEAKRWVI